VNKVGYYVKASTLSKAKYTRREGTPGHYTYFYGPEKGEKKKTEDEGVKRPYKNVKEYVENSYALNNALRTGTRLGAKQQAQIDALDKAVAGSKLTENKRLNRFVVVRSSSLLKKMEKLDVGDVMEDPGYTSATGNKEKFDRAVDRMSDDTYLVLVDIMAPKGSAALGVKEYLGAMEGDAFFEDEYLFPREQKFRILKKTTEGQRIKFTVQALPTMNKALNLEPRAAVAPKHDTVKKGETSPWKAHRQLEGVALDTVSSRLLSLFLEIRKQWLHQKSEFHKASGTELFRLNGRIYINPSTGKPLTQKQWGEVLKSLDSSLRAIFKDQADVLVKRALLLGKILRGMEYESRKETDLSSIPAAQFQYPKEREWENARTFAEQHAAELITDIQSDARKKISTTILDSIKGKQTARQLETALFDKFADLNRDWRMIAETEMATNVNAGILIAEAQDREPGETVYMIGVTAGDACPDCVRLIKNKIVVLSDGPVASGRKKIDGEEYEVIWAGKNNIGRKSGSYWACTPLHPHCRCSWTRYYAEMKDLLGLGKAMKEEEDGGFRVDVDAATKSNVAFRKVIFTGPNAQLVLMSLKPGEDIGTEVHDNLDQFIRVEAGTGKALIGDKEHSLSDGIAVVVPAGSEHNIVAGRDGLKLYTVYTSNHHPKGKVEKTKEGK